MSSTTTTSKKDDSVVVDDQISTTSFDVTLIRHGETNENVQSIIQGQLDTKLNDTGVMQAKLLANSFQIKRYQLIYSSDLSRAYETCRILVRESSDSDASLKDDQSIIRTDVRLRERSFGSLQGSSVTELHRLAKAASKSTVDYTPADGETPAVVHRRAVDFMHNRLLVDIAPFLASNTSANTSIGQHQPEVLIVSHGGVLRELIAYFVSFGHPSITRVSNRCRIIPPNTALNTFRVHLGGDGSGGGNNVIRTVELIRLHDVSHMSEDLARKAWSQKQVNNEGGPAI